jgi:hypothetical protein
MSKPHVAVPPTPYYYGVRAELFLHDAEQALLAGRKDEHARLMVRATHYKELAGQFPLAVYDNRTEEGSNG